MASCAEKMFSTTYEDVTSFFFYEASRRLMNAERMLFTTHTHAHTHTHTHTHTQQKRKQATFECREDSLHDF
jgi:hypothetical protein